MATKSKDGANVGKKEKVLTPSSSQTTKSSSTKPIGSSTPKPSSSSSTSSQGSTEKQIPNYLKPTISSRHDPPGGPKPTLNRRSSFDNKPPSPSRAPTKASPTERAVQPNRSSAKSAPLRSSARGTGTKPQLLHSKSAKKGTGDSLGRKASPSGRGDHKSGPKDSVSSEVHGSEVSDHDDDHALDGQGVQQVAPDQDELKSEDHDHDDQGVISDDHGHDEDKAKVNDIPTVSEELVLKSEDGHDHDDHSDNAVIEESVIDHEKLESNEVEEEKSEDHSEPQEPPNDVTTNEEELAKEEDIKEESEDKLETNNKTTSDDNNGDQVNNGKELGEDNNNNNNEEQEATSEAKKGQTQSGKKESQIAYNDVIEETASKLLEKKKNKVKALVGAFETVIDYESK